MPTTTGTPSKSSGCLYPQALRWGDISLTCFLALTALVYMHYYTGHFVTRVLNSLQFLPPSSPSPCSCGAQNWILIRRLGRSDACDGPIKELYSNHVICIQRRHNQCERVCYSGNFSLFLRWSVSPLPWMVMEDKGENSKSLRKKKIRSWKAGLTAEADLITSRFYVGIKHFARKNARHLRACMATCIFKAVIFLPPHAIRRFKPWYKYIVLETDKGYEESKSIFPHRVLNVLYPVL